MLDYIKRHPQLQLGSRLDKGCRDSGIRPVATPSTIFVELRGVTDVPQAIPRFLAPTTHDSHVLQRKRFWLPPPLEYFRAFPLLISSQAAVARIVCVSVKQGPSWTGMLPMGCVEPEVEPEVEPDVEVILRGCSHVFDGLAREVQYMCFIPRAYFNVLVQPLYGKDPML